ncbi:chemotaxis protein CheW [Alkalibacillus salilacus]|uniref:Purine-binding chemotaxis protein CheW n=1 Tax=Alkalibacillus salilacus TaxID=284582 RepID=A0ABT9VEN2_9BACI|nr:chemotaxis protein CheW [Alkalibacillus salilacus]MDQ0159413.1 purine-binding chemotaxis protein CheW [Alkalibacillus salilacus]
MAEMSKYIIFELNSERFAINIQQVRSIEKLPELTTMPQMPESMKGIFELRGAITPVIDLKEKLEMGQANNDEETRILILTIDEKPLGVIVDKATEVVDIDESTIEAPPEMVAGVDREYITGVAKSGEQLIVILDLDRILYYEEYNVS